MIQKKSLLLRSMMYVPAYKKNYFGNIDSSGADAVILDLEDSVPNAFKARARENIQSFLDTYEKKNIRIYVRINSIASKMLLEDLRYAMHSSVDGFILTKIYTAKDMAYYDRLFSQLENDYGFADRTFSFLPLIETPSAVLDIYQIATSTPRVVGLAFGGEDYLNDMGGYHGTPPKGLDFPRAMIAMAARAANILPIDTPYLKVKDADGFRKEERVSFEMGYAGVQCLHPCQVSLANTIFMPSEQEIREAKEIIAAIEAKTKDGVGVAMLRGNMIGPPMEKRVRRVLDLARQGTERNEGAEK